MKKNTPEYAKALTERGEQRSVWRTGAVLRQRLSRFICACSSKASSANPILPRQERLPAVGVNGERQTSSDTNFTGKNQGAKWCVNGSHLIRVVTFKTPSNTTEKDQDLHR